MPTFICWRVGSEPRNHAADSVDLVLGDGRLRMELAPAHGYDLIVLDAFSSVAIPIHLLTREAIELYLSKLAPGGMLAFHISSRYFRLEPILGATAASLRLNGLSRADIEVSPERIASGREASHWVILTRPGNRIGPVFGSQTWRHVQQRAGLEEWTDDFSSPLSALR